MAKMRMSKELRKLEAAIKPFGHYIEKGKKHHKIRDSNGILLLGFASTPSCRHAYKNVVNQLIKNGKIDIPKW